MVHIDDDEDDEVVHNSEAVVMYSDNLQLLVDATKNYLTSMWGVACTLNFNREELPESLVL